MDDGLLILTLFFTMAMAAITFGVARRWSWMQIAASSSVFVVVFAIVYLSLL
ncbi:MAG: hypothetical protein HC933_03620 [Pleurocapsa sp. SU_196_0]|nr:hypothetical protein [Pleurocapsa sp. SU_196_0]